MTNETFLCIEQVSTNQWHRIIDTNVSCDVSMLVWDKFSRLGLDLFPPTWFIRNSFSGVPHQVFWELVDEE